MTKAELHAAYSWDCDECGKENFVRGVEANLDEPVAKCIEDQDQIDLHYQCIAEPDATESDYLITAIVIAPKKVTCAHCNKTFETELYFEDKEK